jgi:hypothetical protein
MARRSKRSRKNRKPGWTPYIAVLVVLVIFITGAYYAATFITNRATQEFRVYGTTYFITKSTCSNFTFYANSNITSICTTILNISSRSNVSVPYYIILNKYSFLNVSDASSFLQALRSDLNTSPWYSNIPNAYYNSSVVYTTVVYPDYKNTNTSAEVLALYVQNNDVVLSASTSNLTNNANTATMKSYANYLLFNYKNRIENLK